MGIEGTGGDTHQTAKAERWRKRQSTNALLTRNNDAKQDLRGVWKTLVEEEWKGGMWLCEVDGFAA